MNSKANSHIQVGVDTGGTFTDVICYRDGVPIGITKLPSTPSDPSKAILQALDYFKVESKISANEIKTFCHGTTVATNALIERKGGTVGIMSTAGFSDVLEIGRQMRQQLYEVSLSAQAPIFLAPKRRRKGIIERVSSNGSILVPLSEESVIGAAQELVDEGVETIAICFLFSFLNSTHELRAREVILSAFPDLNISISSDVDPNFREYERTVVTAFDAYVKPVVDHYLCRLDHELKNAGLGNEPKIMQSRGGMSAISIARQRPVRLFLSGPAAGVVGAAAVGKSVGENNLISVDIGGTSCDIALIKDSRPNLRNEGEIEKFPVRVNMVDVNTIGAGGGSLIWIDSGGGLRVGPDSAGANPGPACYGRGGINPTVTDASLVLGYIDPQYFADGRVKLEYDLAYKAINDYVAQPLKLSVERAAQGIHQVVNAQMAEGIRLVSIQRGLDPRKFTLLPLGGAGPLHATALAEELSITKIVVPRSPGVLSAMGLLAAPVEHESLFSIQKNITDLSSSFVLKVFEKLDEECSKLIKSEGVNLSGLEIQHIADVCYVGQSHYLAVPIFKDSKNMFKKLIEEFNDQHDQVYGHAANTSVKIINLRSIHRVNQNSNFVAKGGNKKNNLKLKEERLVFFLSANSPKQVKIFDRGQLSAGMQISGPAIIEQPDTTIVIENEWEAIVEKTQDIILNWRRI